MKTILASLVLIFLIAISFSCKSTKEASSEPDPIARQQANPAQPSQEDFDYYAKQPKGVSLDPADVERVVNYAKEKANLVCKIQAIEKQSEGNPELADENKRKIVSLEQNIKALDTQNESFMDDEDKWRYYNKVYEKEMEKCH